MIVKGKDRRRKGYYFEPIGGSVEIRRGLIVEKCADREVYVFIVLIPRWTGKNGAWFNLILFWAILGNLRAGVSAVTYSEGEGEGETVDKSKADEAALP